MSFENKVVVITGASSGLGRALTLAFAKEKARLAICARSEARLLEVKHEAETLGGQVLAVSADVSRSQDMERFVAVIEKHYHSIDVLINNASILGPSPIPYLLDYPELDFEEVVRVNALSPFLITKRILPVMLLQRNGLVINVTSEAGHTGYAGWGAYGVSKFALEGLTQTWADELDGTGVRICMVDPGEMDTEMHAQAVPDCDYELNDPNTVAKAFLAIASKEGEGYHGKRVQAEDFLEKEGYADEILNDL